ncbi:MAG TPA: glycoside hydrolase family 15 [Dermatophilaceae bacterium]|nr:glycoside hydrolase family 15 [Dermatophilaceae bacterium]
MHWRQRVPAALAAAAVVAAGFAVGGAVRGPDLSFEPALVTRPGYRAEPTDVVERATAARHRTWVDAGRVPGSGTRFEPMSRWALSDIRTLLRGNGAVPAGAGDRWSYVWPRDAAFVAVALARTGHPGEARGVLGFLDRLPFDPADGFDARYTLTGARVDPTVARPPQSDGCGWVLWALGEVRSADPAAVPRSAAGLRERCTAQLLTATDSGRRLPAPSPDYWEVDVDETSLGTVAPMVAGLRAASVDARAGGDETRARSLAQATSRLREVVAEAFGPAYQRFGDDGGVDAATTFLLPPFAPGSRDAGHAVRGYQERALRVSGGLAPGEEWKQDGTSWTPETALVAYTAAASGRRDVAERWLDWLDAHRTAYGSLPEKVTRRGMPAGPAPLLWTSALVLLALDALDAPTSAAPAAAPTSVAPAPPAVAPGQARRASRSATRAPVRSTAPE